MQKEEGWPSKSERSAMLLRETTARVDSLSEELANKEKEARAAEQRLEDYMRQITGLKTKIAMKNKLQ